MKHTLDKKSSRLDFKSQRKFEKTETNKQFSPPVRVKNFVRGSEQSGAELQPHSDKTVQGRVILLPWFGDNEFWEFPAISFPVSLH